MQFLKIVALGVVTAILYGIVHDQVTARVCVEYFTVGHPRVIASQSPTVLALVWGVLATWWAGLFVGVLVALAARIGRRPKLSARDLLLPVVRLLVSMGLLSFAAGAGAYWMATGAHMQLSPPLGTEIARDRHALFLADAAAHQVAYLAGFVGSLILGLWIVQERGRRASAAQQATSDKAGIAET